MPSNMDLPVFATISLAPIPSDINEDWLHPIFEIFRPQPAPIVEKKSKLYLVPSVFGDEYDPDFAPEPTSARELPELNMWCANFTQNVLEVYAGKRSAAQLNRLFHHKTFNDLLRKSGSEKEVGRIRKLHILQPLDGICETTATVRFGGRLRALTYRFEGVDGRWLCTALLLI